MTQYLMTFRTAPGRGFKSVYKTRYDNLKHKSLRKPENINANGQDKQKDYRQI